MRNEPLLRRAARSGSQAPVAPLERRVAAQLAALTEAVRAAFARAAAVTIATDQTGRRHSAEIAGALRLVRASAKLATAFARLRGFRYTVNVTHRDAQGRVLSRTSRTFESAPSWPVVRPPKPPRAGKGVPPPKNEVRITARDPAARRRGGQPGNRNRLRHGRWSRAADANRAEIRALLYETECLIARIHMVGRMRQVWRARSSVAPRRRLAYGFQHEQNAVKTTRYGRFCRVVFNFPHPRSRWSASVESAQGGACRSRNRFPAAHGASFNTTRMPCARWRARTRSPPSWRGCWRRAA